MKKKATGPYETSVCIFRIARRHAPKDSINHIRHHDNLRSQQYKKITVACYTDGIQGSGIELSSYVSIAISLCSPQALPKGDLCISSDLQQLKRKFSL